MKTKITKQSIHIQIANKLILIEIDVTKKLDLTSRDRWEWGWWQFCAHDRETNTYRSDLPWFYRYQLSMKGFQIRVGVPAGVINKFREIRECVIDVKKNPYGWSNYYWPDSN